MSLNLYFQTESGEIYDFPFQTPTWLTHKVMSLDVEDSLKEIEKYLDDTNTESWWKGQLMAMIKMNLSNPGVTLTYM